MRTVHVFANYALGVFEGATGKRLAFRTRFYHDEVDGVPWRRSLGEYSAAERQQMAGVLRALLAKDIPAQLRSVRVGG